MQVRAKEGDTLDILCQQHLGSTSSFEHALLLNPELANFPIIPKGTLVTLPDVATPQKQRTINLWD